MIIFEKYFIQVELSAPGALVEPGLAAGLSLRPAKAGAGGQQEPPAPGEVLENGVAHCAPGQRSAQGRSCSLMPSRQNDKFIIAAVMA